MRATGAARRRKEHDVIGRTTRNRTLAAMGALALCAALVQPGLAAASNSPSVDVTVNANEGMGTIPATGYGLNSAVWDDQMNVPAVQGLLSQAGIGMLRYPGGSYGDIYHWQTNTATGGFVAPGTDFDSFMGTVKTIGAQPIIIANYGTGTPQESIPNGALPFGGSSPLPMIAFSLILLTSLGSLAYANVKAVRKN